MAASTRAWVRSSIACARTTAAPTTGSATTASMSPTLRRTRPYAAVIRPITSFRPISSGRKLNHTTIVSCHE